MILVQFELTRNFHLQVANVRHNALFRRFISALTHGGPGGLPRPIEVHAHDPLRYVGDMLGWLHQVSRDAFPVNFIFRAVKTAVFHLDRVYLTLLSNPPGHVSLTLPL